MSSKSAGYVWLTFLGRSLYETLNPYWGYCEAGRVPPKRIVILHPAEMQKEKNRAVDAFTIISDEYYKKNSPGIESLSYDQGNISNFTKRTDGVFRDAASKSWELLLDISPTTWSFVPIYLAKRAMVHKNTVASIIYFQYMNDAHRNRPYPLIPRFGITAHDMLSEIV